MLCAQVVKHFAIFKFDWLLDFEQCNMVMTNPSTWEIL